MTTYLRFDARLTKLLFNVFLFSNHGEKVLKSRKKIVLIWVGRLENNDTMKFSSILVLQLAGRRSKLALKFCGLKILKCNLDSDSVSTRKTTPALVTAITFFTPFTSRITNIFIVYFRFTYTPLPATKKMPSDSVSGIGWKIGAENGCFRCSR